MLHRREVAHLCIDARGIPNGPRAFVLTDRPDPDAACLANRKEYEGFRSGRLCELVKRRLKDAGLPLRLSPHSFRVTAMTDLFMQGILLEDVQYLAGHAEPQTTGPYVRRRKKGTRNFVERISI